MFRRQIELIGEEKQKELAKKSVLIVGAGGLGNVVSTNLGCIGLKKITIIDFDKIENHNIHRQFNFTKSDIGRFKAEVLAEKIGRCETEIQFFNLSFNDFIVKNSEKFDLIIDCSDNFEVREEIDSYSDSWLYGSVESWIGQVCLFDKGDFKIFNKQYSHKVSGVMPSMVSLIGSIQSNIATKYLSNLEVEKDKLYFIDFQNSLEIKKFNL